METLRTTTDAEQVITVWIDVHEKSVNTISPLMLAELDELLIELERLRPRGPRAVIFASGKPHAFIAGADLFAIRKMDRPQIEEFLLKGQRIFERVAHLPVKTVAAIGGDCLGGGLEWALACSARVAADDPSISIGLPEVKLGILPGWGGTVRLPQLIGLPRALPLLLAGKTMPPRKAAKVGIVDEVVRPEALLAAARRVALAPAEPKHLSMMSRATGSIAPVRNRVFEKAARQTRELTHGNYPAPIRLIEVVRTGYEHGPAAGFDAERNALVELIDTPAGQNLVRLFFLRQGAKRAIGNQLTAKPREVKYAAVIGGGTMGAGIAHGLLRAGVLVRLIEVNPQAAGAGVGRVKRMLEEDVAAGRITRLQAKHALHHLSPTTEWTGLRLADLVVEAVIERMDAKREVFAKLDRLTRSDAVLATNTSSLSVTEMAAATEHRGRVVGLHFFNPVPKMALVEVVRTADSDDVSLATAAAIALRMGKTPVLVKDAPGFVVNRILIPYLLEALAMATEDAPIREVDVAMKQWGMPMGPFELLDEIGLDTGWHVLRSLGGMLDQQVQTPAAVEQAVGRGWLGKKSGRGFYLYDDKKKAGDVNEEFVAMLRTCQGEFSAEAAQWRLVLPMVNAAAMLLEAGVVDSADTIDLATVLGTGFAPFRGGVMHFADSVGAEEIVARLHELAKRHGPRFAPAPLLLRAAAMKSSVSHLAPVAPATSSPARDASASKPTHA